MKLSIVAAALAVTTAVSAMSSYSKGDALADRSDFKHFERELDELDLYERNIDDELYERQLDDLFDEIVARDFEDLQSRKFGGKLYLNITGTTSSSTKKDIEKALRKYADKLDKSPHCNVIFGDGGSFQYRCFTTASKKVGELISSGAMKL